LLTGRRRIWGQRPGRGPVQDQFPTLKIQYVEPLTSVICSSENENT